MNLPVWLERIHLSTPWVLHDRLSDAEADVLRLFNRLGILEEEMARTAEQLAADFNTATDEVAADLQAVRDEVAALKVNMDTASAAAVDAALANLDAPLARLQALGADPADPIPPAPEPEPAPEPPPL